MTTKRYFRLTVPGKAVNLKGQEWYAVCDEDALGRVLAEELRQYLPGGASFVVTEISQEAFRLVRSQAGAVSI